MENENKPQQDGQKPDSAPLTAKKKQHKRPQIKQDKRKESGGSV